jgi:hypothetical protein
LGHMLQSSKLGPSDIQLPDGDSGYHGLSQIGRQNTLPEELDRVGQEIAAFCGAWAQNVELKL